MIVVLTLVGFAFLAFIFVGIGYSYGDQAGFMRAAEKYREEMEQALEEKERGISELRKLAIDNVITVTKFYYQKERTIRESQHGNN
jgi:hypothetical protein